VSLSFLFLKRNQILNYVHMAIHHVLLEIILENGHVFIDAKDKKVMAPRVEF
jgi:hypothetical protein